MSRGEGGGRPLKIKTPQEFEEKAMAVYNKCLPDDGDIPTILWLESQLDIDFYDYYNRPKFSDTATRIKKRFDSLYEQKANKGIVVPQIAKMKLAHHQDYAPIVQEVDVRTIAVVESPVFKSVLAKTEALDVSHREMLIDDLRNIVEGEDKDSDS